MNVAFFTNYIYTPHYETELELIQTHLDKGNTVYHFVCDAHLLSCDFNPTHDLLKCSLCIGKRQRGQRLLENKKNYFEIKISRFHEKVLQPELKLSFDSISELRSYKIGNFEIGEATLSSLVSILRDPKPDPHIHHTLLSNIIMSANYIYHYFQKELQQYKINEFYIFNGRFAINRAALRASQKLEIVDYIHERGSNYKTYGLFENGLPHEIKPLVNRIRRFWEDHSGNDKRAEIAHNFYKDRTAGKDQGWISFVKEQKSGLLPQNWNPSDDNIVVFNSSEDEFVAIGKDWDMGSFGSQNELILKLMNDSRLSEKKLWLRLHPNMKKMAKEYLDKTFAIFQGNIGVILPDSLINSYDLMHSASKVLTFGSTVGVEATYWGKTSILIGPSFYKDFNVTYNPTDYEELINLLLDNNLKPLPKENTLPYGFYLNSYGIPFKFFKPKDLFNGEYRGKNLNNTLYYYAGLSLSTKPGLRNIYAWLNKRHYKSLLKKYTKVLYHSKQ